MRRIIFTVLFCCTLAEHISVYYDNPREKGQYIFRLSASISRPTSPLTISLPSTLNRPVSELLKPSAAISRHLASISRQSVPISRPILRSKPSMTTFPPLASTLKESLLVSETLKPSGSISKTSIPISRPLARISIPSALISTHKSSLTTFPPLASTLKESLLVSKTLRLSGSVSRIPVSITRTTVSIATTAASISMGPASISRPYALISTTPKPSHTTFPSFSSSLKESVLVSETLKPLGSVSRSPVPISRTSALNSRPSAISRSLALISRPTAPISGPRSSPLIAGFKGQASFVSGARREPAILRPTPFVPGPDKLEERQVKPLNIRMIRMSRNMKATNRNKNALCLDLKAKIVNSDRRTNEYNYQRKCNLDKYNSR